MSDYDESRVQRPGPDSEITFSEEESDLIVGTATPVEDGPATVDLLEAWRARLLMGGTEERPTAQEVNDYVAVRDDPAKLEEVRDRMGGARALELLGIEATEERVTHFLSNKTEIQANIAQLREAVGAGKTDIADELTQKLTDLTGANLPGGTPFGTTLGHIVGTANPANPAKPGKSSDPGGGEKPPASSTPPAGSEDPPRDPPTTFAERAADRAENRPAKQQQSDDDDPLPYPVRTLQDQYNEEGYPDQTPSYTDDTTDDDTTDDDTTDDDTTDDDTTDDGSGDDGEGLTTGEEAPLDERLAGDVERAGALRDALEPDTRRTNPPMVAKGPDYDPRWAEPLGPLDPPPDPIAPIALYPEGEGPTSAAAGRGLIRDTGQGIDPGNNPEGPDYDPRWAEPLGPLGPPPDPIGPISQPTPAATASVGDDAHDSGLPAPDPVGAAAPDAPAPQVGPGPAAEQPGDFVGPAPGEKPEGAVFEDAHREGEEPGFNDDVI